VNITSIVGFEVPVAVARENSIFWNITLYSPVNSAGRQGALSQKTELFFTLLFSLLRCNLMNYANEME
jgi:hypothetical protein